MNQKTKTDFYFDVDTTPAQLVGTNSTRVKVEITARNTETNKVETNPYQRVKVNAVTLGKAMTQAADYRNHISAALQEKYQDRGSFVLSDTTQPEIAKLMTLQTTRNKDNYTYYADGSTNTVFTDLINGKATVYYDFAGISDALNTPLTFIVQPTTFELKTNVWGVGQKRGEISSDSNRSKQNLTLPEKPTTYVGQTANPRLNTPDLPTVEPNFLYRTWQTDELTELVYTVKAVPINPTASNWLAQIVVRITIGQMLLVLFTGLMLAWQVRQQKHKSKLTDVQTN